MLKVYRASAGSGKTYRLTYEYIKMLLGHRNEHDEYYTFYSNYNNSHRHILAVTFTNKATEEMKQRIVSQLDVLAHNPQKSDYINDLCTAFRSDVQVIQHNATKVLQQLLQDFSFFSISTIDSFFQQILRAFTREVGLQGGYEVELDSSYVTMTAIDRMFENIGHENEKELFNWILQYAKEQILNGNSWDIHSRSDLPSLASHLSSEVYKRYSVKLSEIKLSDYESYRKTLHDFQDQYLNEVVEAAQQAQQALIDSNISPDLFARKWIDKLNLFSDKELIKSDSKFFQKTVDFWKNKMDNTDTWFAKTKLKKTHSVDEMIHLIMPSFMQLNDLFGERLIKYNSVKVALQHIYAMGVLSTIHKYIDEYSQEHNSILLSETPDILQGLINKSDAPFIYEKIGTRISHYMIDEFQDTSNLQWNNFEPLVNESLSYNNENLIVGDVKQSIYRWRNSDWRLLHEGLNKFDYTSLTTEHDTNWRSCRDVIAFNNSFFKIASVILQSRISERMKVNNLANQDNGVIEKIYSNVLQKVSPKQLNNSGRVDVHIVKSINADEFVNQMLERLPQLLEELLQRGYRQKDILILVRKGDEGCKIVELLLALAGEHSGKLRNIKVVSDDSLLLSSAAPVKLIVGILRYIQNPGYDLNRLLLAYEHGLIKGSTNNESLSNFFENESDKHQVDDELKSLIQELSSKPLFEMCEQIIHHFKMNDKAEYIAYIEAFQDIIIDYCRSHSSDIYSFLRWWDDNEKSFTVKSPIDIDAISVLTIHKSKGLEYPVVIIPFAHWAMSRASSNQPTTMWYEPTIPPFNLLPVLPIDHKTELVSTIFAPQFFNELVSEYVDNINLAYVAFTRAKQELIVYARTSSKFTIGDLINETLNSEVVSQFDDCPTMDFNSYVVLDDDNEKVITIGDKWTPIIEEKPLADMVSVAYNVVLPTQNRLKQRVTAANVSGNKLRNKGILMHEILSLIYTADDIDKVVQQCVREGRLMRKQAPEITRELNNIISHPRVQRWFSTDVKVLNETDIIISDKAVRRPDRVVIDGDKVIVVDYKFGKVERNTYKKQVALYMQYLREMGYTHVEGCVWYVTEDKFIAVE